MRQLHFGTPLRTLPNNIPLLSTALSCLIPSLLPQPQCKHELGLYVALCGLNLTTAQTDAVVGLLVEWMNVTYRNELSIQKTITPGAGKGRGDSAESEESGELHRSKCN